MNARTSRVEALLRREIADMLRRGDFRDPRLAHSAAISITGVRVAADLSTARVFVDVLGEEASVFSVLDALNAASGLVRTQIGRRLRLRRAPTIRFERDESIERGAAIERVLAELARERPTPEPIAPASEGDDASEGSHDADEGDDASEDSHDADGDDDADDDDDASEDDER